MGHAPVVVPGSVVSDPFAAPRALPRGRAGGSASGSPAIPRGAEARGCVGSPSEAARPRAPGSSHVTPPELGARFGTGSLNAGSLSNGPLDAPRPSRRLAPSGRPGAAPRPSQLVSQQVLQHLKVQRLVGHDALELDLPRFRGRVSDEVFKLSLSPGRGKLPPRSGGVEHSDARDRRLYVRIRNRLTRIRPATPLSERLDARS